VPTNSGANLESYDTDNFQEDICYVLYHVLVRDCIIRVRDGIKAFPALIYSRTTRIILDQKLVIYCI